jgi:hypothetical protein
VVVILMEIRMKGAFVLQKSPMVDFHQEVLEIKYQTLRLEESFGTSKSPSLQEGSDRQTGQRPILVLTHT